MNVSSNRLVKKSLIFSIVFLIIILAVFFVLIIFSSNLTGNAALEVSSASGKVLEGALFVDPSQIGPLPSETIVRIDYGDQLKSANLYDLLPPDYDQYSISGQLFSPVVTVNVVYYPDSYLDNFYSSGGGDADIGGNFPPIIDGGDSPNNPGKGIGAHVISEGESEIFSVEYNIRFGLNTEIIPRYPGYTAKAESAKIGDISIDKKFITFSEVSNGYELSTSRYDIVQGISRAAPSFYIYLKDFGLMSGEADSISIHFIYSGGSYYDVSSEIPILNVKKLNFHEEDRVIARSDEFVSEVVFDGVAHTINIGQEVTQELQDAGCFSYTCDNSQACSIPSLEVINRNVLVPVRVTSCQYNCGVSFKIIESCEIPSDETSVEKIDKNDLGYGYSNSADKFSSYLAIVKKETNDPLAIITYKEDSRATDIAFLQSPPNFGDLCKNGVLDSSEEKVDCGGSCISCTTHYSDYSILVIVIGAFSLGILFFVSLFRENF